MSKELPRPIARIKERTCFDQNGLFDNKRCEPYYITLFYISYEKRTYQNLG